MYKILLKTAGFLIIPFTSFANQRCDSFKSDPEIITSINYATPVYKSVSKDKIMLITELKNPLQTMGVTVADFSIGFSMSVDRNLVADGYCMNVNSIKFDIGYNSLDVLIDEKYRSHTCQYEEIKKHEQEHVKIYQNELKYYGKLIVDEIKILFENMPAFFMPYNATELQITKKIDKMLKNDVKLNLLKNRLERAILDKNIAHDSDEEYLRVKNSCSSW